MEKKIIAITSKLFPGVTSVFSNAQSLGLLKYKYVEDFKEDKADLWIFGAWQNGYQDLIDNLQGKKAILITSSIGQIEQSGEFPILNHIFALLKSKDIDYIFFGSKDASEVFRGDGVYYFPYPFDYKIKKYTSPYKMKDNIGMFLPTAPRKNCLNQLSAFILASRKRANLKLHTNTKMIMPGDIKYHEWLPEDKFFNLISKMQLVLHVTHTESFAYNALEALNLDTIPIVSPCVEENLNLPAQISVKNPDSPVEIAKKINEILNLTTQEYQKLLIKCQEKADSIVSYNNQKLRELLEKI